MEAPLDIIIREHDIVKNNKSVYISSMRNTAGTHGSRAYGHEYASTSVTIPSSDVIAFAQHDHNFTLSSSILLLE